MTEIPLLASPTRDKTAIEATYLDAIVREDVFPAGALQLGLPKLWRAEAFGVDNKPTRDTPLVELVRATPGVPEAFGASHDARVQVWCVLLPRVMNGSDWLHRWAETQGYVSHAFRELPTKNGIMGDAVVTAPATNRLHRLVTMKDGDLIYLVDGSVDPKGAPHDPALQEIALMAAMRFKLLAPSGVRYAEPMEERFVTSALAQTAFFLPQSWTPQPAGDAPENGASAMFTTQVDGSPTGSLVVALGPSDISPEDLEETLVAKLSNQGFTFGDAVLSLDLDRKGYRHSVLRRESDAGSDTATTLLCLRGTHHNLPLSICLLTPSPATAFEAWAVNRRVFEIILESHALGAF